MIDGLELAEYISEVFDSDEVALFTGRKASPKPPNDKRTGKNALGALIYNLEQEKTVKFDAILENSYIEARCSSPGRDGYKVRIENDDATYESKSLEHLDEKINEIEEARKKTSPRR